MLYDAFWGLLEGVIVDIILWVQKMSTWLIETSLKVESAMWISDNPLTQELITSIYNYIYGAVVVLVVLKFIWKGFQVYVLWRDGDADVSPHTMLIGACLAIIVSLAFPTVYNVAVSATADIGNGILDRINDRWVNKPVVDYEDIDERAEIIWNDFFAEYDTDHDRVISKEEYENIPDDRETMERLNAIFPELANVSEEDAGLTAVYVQLKLDFYMQGGQLSLSGIRTILTEKVSDALGAQLSGAMQSLAALAVLLIYLVLYVIMYIKLLGRGIEMMFLRWGIPIAAIGLVNSDGGIFPSYVQLLLRQMVTSVLQLVAMYLSFWIAMDFSLSHVLMALAIIGVAFKGPALMAQILAPQRQGGGLGQKLHTALMLRNLWRH